MSIVYELVKSWHASEGNVTTNEEILAWVAERNANLKVSIEKTDFSYDGFWHYDEASGWVRNNNDSFFQLSGIQQLEDGRVVREQPIILQREVGYLGIICKRINGVLNFLMQAKIEPGNVNVIQISPTIQATKSNFTRKHGGKAPSYLEYFENSASYRIVVDQLQSEQSSRFLKKRNRNIMILLDEDVEVEVLPSHRWMTLGQIKAMMRYDNLVNMDTRTVLSCIPFTLSETEPGELEAMRGLFSDDALFRSMFKAPDYEAFHRIFNALNDGKMYAESDSVRLVPLKALDSWEMSPREIWCPAGYDFKVIYCKIEIEGREVRYWDQPLVEALAMYLLGTFTCVEDGVRKFLVRTLEEMGCFDTVELGPLMQLEPDNPRNALTPLESLFMDRLDRGEGVLRDVILSEEGGRFYHEQNRNVLIEIDRDAVGPLPKGCFWVDFATLNHMMQFNNCVNIQLRNLTALLDM